jgi:hypothetical protein
VANAVPVAEMPQAAPPAVHPSPVRVASAARPVVPHVTFTKPARKPAARVALASAPRWTAQLGIFARMSKARIEAVAVKQMRGVGVARIARVEQHGRILWTAQLAGLTLDAAHDTCDALAARGDSCRVIGPYADHLAMENAANKSGA